MPGTRSFVAGRFAFQLDGQVCGFLNSVRGGNVSADVITEPADRSGFAKKHIGLPKYEEFAVQFGFAMANELYDWISASWDRKYARKNGAVVSTDNKLAPVAEVQFTNALLTETTIPALDASSKEAAYLTVKFAPEYTRAGKPSTKLGKLATDKQKVFTAANFKVEIDGLDCSRVNKVDAFTIRQVVVPANVGEARATVRKPGNVEFPNLTITFAEATAKTWNAWFEDFVIKGNNGDGAEKSGAVVLLSADLKKELARITLHNVGICALRRQPVSDTAVRRVTAELYCERMELKVGAP
jgi:phage tail-like protein